MFGELFITGYALFALNIPSIFPIRNSVIPEPAISAQSALLIDAQNGRTFYSKNPHEVLPLASLTKLASSLVVLESIPLENEILLTQEIIATPGGAGNYVPGEIVAARHLLFSSLIQSSNDAMMGLASSIGQRNFLSLLQDKKVQLDLKSANLADPTGLDPKTQGTAYDVVKLARAAFSNQLIAQILSIPEYVFTSSNGIAHKSVSTNRLIFDSRVLVGKTGTLGQVGENYVALIKPRQGERNLILVILGSTNRERDALSLLDWFDRAYIWE